MDYSVVSWTLFLYGLFYYCGRLVQPVRASPEGKIWVVCVAGFDKYEYTYGIEGGIYRACRMFAGEKSDNLIIISPDTAAYHVKNSVPGKVVHGKQYIYDWADNYYDKINVTYNSRDMTADRFYGILSGNRTAVKGVGSEKVLLSGPQDTVVLIFINWGSYGVMSLTNTEPIYAEKFVPFLEHLKENNKFKQMLIIAEGQNIASMFDGYLCTDCGIIALTNGGKQDELEVCHINYDVMAWTSTCYMYFLLQHLERSLNEGDILNSTLFDVYQQVRTRVSILDGIPHLYGQLDMGNQPITDFLNVKK